MASQKIQILKEWNGRSILEVLAVSLDISKGTAKKLLDAKRVYVNNRRVWMAKHALKAGDIVEIYELQVQKTSLEIIYKDDFLIAINKPPGLLSNGPKSAELLLQREEHSKKIQAVHRLDKDTSGCLLFARSDEAFERFTKLFRERAIKKTYLVWCVGDFSGTSTVVDQPIDGKSARTLVKVVKRKQDLILFEVQPETGRTHQIRKHMLSLGVAVLGDREYTTKRSLHPRYRTVKRQLLHASGVRFIHPFTGKDINIKAPEPDDFQ